MRRRIIAALPLNSQIRGANNFMEMLIGHTSGFAVPTYVVDAPGGGGVVAQPRPAAQVVEGAGVVARTTVGRVVVEVKGLVYQGVAVVVLSVAQGFI